MIYRTGQDGYCTYQSDIVQDRTDTAPGNGIQDRTGRILLIEVGYRTRRIQF